MVGTRSWCHRPARPVGGTGKPPADSTVPTVARQPVRRAGSSGCPLRDGMSVPLTPRSPGGAIAGPEPLARADRPPGASTTDTAADEGAVITAGTGPLSLRAMSAAH